MRRCLPFRVSCRAYAFGKLGGLFAFGFVFELGTRTCKSLLEPVWRQLSGRRFRAEDTARSRGLADPFAGLRLDFRAFAE